MFRKPLSVSADEDQPGLLPTPDAGKIAANPIVHFVQYGEWREEYTYRISVDYESFSVITEREEHLVD